MLGRGDVGLAGVAPDGSFRLFPPGESREQTLTLIHEPLPVEALLCHRVEVLWDNEVLQIAELLIGFWHDHKY